jgi:hypothetical protein
MSSQINCRRKKITALIPNQHQCNTQLIDGEFQGGWRTASCIIVPWALHSKQGQWGVSKKK